MRGKLLVIALAACGAVLLAGPANASEIIARNASQISLQVDKNGYALVTFKAQGKEQRVLLWGAVDAKVPARGAAQTTFKKDYSGGWGHFHAKYWLTMKNACTRYTGPKLPWFVMGCDAPDGSHWALQSWQRMLPDLGETPWKPEQAVWELHVSHWTGDHIAQLDVYTDWSYAGRFHHLFGKATYDGKGVYGFSATRSGVPLDAFGRNLYLDTFDSAYGAGWKRENSFLAHPPNGTFCYGFYPHPPYPGYPAGNRPEGNGSKYRITMIGPGVTPDVMWEGAGLPDYDKANPQLVQHETDMNALELQLAGPDTACRHT